MFELSDEIIIEVRQGVAWVALNRPSQKNAITAEMFEELTEFFATVAADRDVRALVLTGNGQDFCSGGNLKISPGYFDSPAAERAANIDQLVAGAQATMRALHQLPQPVLASVRGHVIGAGMQMVLLADLVVASESAKFWLPNVGLAHNVDHGETYTLPRKVGHGRAAQIALLGERVRAADAERWGIVNWLVDDDQLDRKTRELAKTLAAAPPVAVREMKALLRGGEHDGLDIQLTKEREALQVCAATEDFVEANRAFAEKRPPVYRGL